MGTRKHRGKMAAQGPIIKSFGTYRVQDVSGQRVLTLSSALAPEPFDISKGAEIKVEQVDPDDEPAFLRLTQVEG